jgi:hypothetical protein
MPWPALGMEIPTRTTTTTIDSVYRGEGGANGAQALYQFDELFSISIYGRIF